MDVSPSKKKTLTKRDIANRKEKKEETTIKENQVENKVGLLYFQYGYDLLRYYASHRNANFKRE